MRNPASDILIVDDVPANLRLLADLLKQAGYKARPVPSGQLALKAAAHQPPDLILLDINMPELDGYQVCKRLKEDDRLRDIPVIFISARSETIDKLKAFAAGAVDYLTKPFQFEEVQARVQTHLALRRYRQELNERNLELERALVELKHTQAHLVQSEKLASLGGLTAGIAHEINNPVNFIRASAVALRNLVGNAIRVCDAISEIDREAPAEGLAQVDALVEELDFDEVRTGLAELTKNLITGVDRTADIVSGLRTFSRLGKAEREHFDLREGIESTLTLLAHRLGESIRVETSYADMAPVLCFPGKLNQALMNLLSNAIDAIGEKSAPGPDDIISVATSVQELESGPVAIIRIADTGVGMTDETKKHLFEPFFTTKDVGQGTGLGLSITHGIIADHGGEIHVTSSLGKGTTFAVHIPVR